jgi:Flp pilus assembly protein TadD
LNTRFAFAGEPDEQFGHNVTPDYDDRPLIFTKSLQGVSAKEEKIPDVPIVALAEDEITLAIADRNSPAAEPKTIVLKDEWQRWNDYGIGLFLQGDLKAAAAAFQKVTEADPNNPDGWVNLGRCAVQEGDMERARVVLEKALALSPNLARANYFYARVLRSDGNYEAASAHLSTVLKQYPRDRVALNDLGRILFLQRKYQEAVTTFESVLAIDPEDLQAHYNLMLCYNGLGNQQLAKAHQARYMRFKADESSQAITGPYRQAHPEDNNERQAVHEHVSVPLAAISKSKAPLASLTASGAAR